MLLYSIVLVIMVVILLFVFLYMDTSSCSSEKFVTNKMYMPIYIVSIPERKESRLVPLLSRIKTDPRYRVREVYGVVGKDVVVQTVEPFLNNGQIGCFMSHYGIWKKIMADTGQMQMALVLEDDAIINLPEMYDAIQEVINNLPDNWEVCYLGGNYHDIKKAYNVSKNIMKSDTSLIWHSHAYLIRKRAAIKLVDMSKSVLEKTHIKDYDNILPLDDWMTHPDRRMNVYKVEPELVKYALDGVSDTSK